MHCGRFLERPISRRDMLIRSANGFGALALTSLLGESAYGRAIVPSQADGHPVARAKSVICLFMDGGPSQVDTFDPKPRLDREHGEAIKVKPQPTQFDNVGKVLKSPWAFRQHGQSGIPVSDLFPETAKHVDDMAIIRSMVSTFSEHTAANYFMHTGSGLQGRPSHGAWVTYGLGSECRDLPGFVVLNGGLIPPGGLDCFTNGFLPATFQGSIFRPGKQAVANLGSADTDPEARRRKMELLGTLDRGVLGRVGNHDALEASIANDELAARMQLAVPDLTEISGETEATKKLYRLDDPYPQTQIYGRQLLLARRMVERGVRFIEVLCPNVGSDRWDQHSNLAKGHADNARATDGPISGLLTDLKSRGLLDSTLVVWGGEFGRTPMAQGTDGRDHNPYGFTMWMAGGGIKGGVIHGATDDYGYHAVEDKVEVHDLHATMLHLLGVDHTRLTARFGGRDMRLTDVHGEVVRPILA